MKNKFTISLLLVVFLLLGCNQNEIYFEYETVPQGKWNKDSLLQFNFHVNSVSDVYDMYLHVRHYGDYPYQNAWFFLEYLEPQDSIEGIKDTIEFYLADEYGRWLGNGVGALKEMPIYLRRRIQFPDTGNYTLKVKQGMRDSVLVGINDVGLRIEKITE